MKLFVLGVNHETAPVDIREKISFSPEQVRLALSELKTQSLATECVILSTCNRTEIYATLNNEDTHALYDWLHQFFQLQEQSISQFLYEYTELEAIKHIMRVASGLNSLVLGEPQILGQIKDAYHLAHKNDSIHQTLHALFQCIFKTAKQVRTDTEIGSSPVSVAFAAVALSKQFFGCLKAQNALLIGAGETIELVARHLKENQIGNLIIANRTLSKAHQLTEALGGYAINLDEISNHLHEADIVIASTASPNAIIHTDMVESALKKRRHKPMFMVDIAVPRDIEAKVGDFSDTYLYSVDDLQEIIEENKQSRQDAALAAEEIIDAQAQVFINQFKATQVVSPIIQSYRQQAHELKQQLLSETHHQLELGADPSTLLTKLANQLTNKILHTSTYNLNQAGLNGEREVLDAAKRLLLPTVKPTEDPIQKES
ncbi:MAG: glutamyl-tRNA reductase [Piscirickettsiaceae bacterium CG_4_9_14_3_um_filter_43_564]|nr:glutamyl-tRNA reductase [Thiomicrospira sp.]OIP96330.1 MAG: glutamyl-tRNA reductase [Thiomicrospira sp. CG2_30_44_34]PIQ04521.1 MAG: glutamyl-tRNA reductase [Piscirickettsiaceae bacterium CG18_big_fil_WC_8_21_14_2_50_44_103]PIU38721.1 MAG: glutamyl-tRNA reductase [Piscirickettsiaceae bacterium CG07_land_8_20_14_0_80_44_28]PIW58079.1 MAG: glutamyl-tRNA reductase [Piscirickettsiaceae bacterium CG12_big_fil_rev_8_21_14_0_65_44_934]PIW78223.1 MAG: glutamyl-tRNA reductase [Piscirickettsiaceae ba